MPEHKNRKVFFLHPQAVIQDDLVNGLIEENYECYLIRNASSAKTALRAHPDGVLLIQVDSGLTEEQWFTFAGEIKDSPTMNGATLAVLSIKAEDSIRERFMVAGSPFEECFTYSGFNYDKSLDSIRSFLDANKARLPGNQIRGVAPEDFGASIVFVRDSERYEGSLRDITIVGMTCRLGQESLLPSEVPVQNIVISYGSKQFSVSGKIAGKHGKEEALHLILFEEWCKEEKRAEIYELIHDCLQAEMKGVINAKGHKRQLVTKTPRSALYRKKS